MKNSLLALAALAVMAIVTPSHVLADAPPAVTPPPPPKWETTAALGLSFTSGNSDTLLFTGALQTKKKWLHDEVVLGADGAYGEDDSVVNNSTAHGYGQWNHLFTERLYSYARIDGLYDGIADLDYRFTLSPGAGYYFVKQTNMIFAGECGPGYILQKKGGETDNYFTLRLAERFEYKFTGGAKIWQSFEYLPDVTEWGKYVFNAEVGASAPLNKVFSLRIVFQDTYDSRPAAGRVSNDMKILGGIECKF